MADSQKNLRKAYESAKKHYSLPDFETFKADMADPEKLGRFHSSLTKHYSVPDIDQFSKDMGFGQEPSGKLYESGMQDLASAITGKSQINLSEVPNVNEELIRKAAAPETGFEKIGGVDPVDDPGDFGQRGLQLASDAGAGAVDFMSNLVTEFAPHSMPGLQMEADPSQISDAVRNLTAHLNPKPARGKYARGPKSVQEALDPTRIQMIVGEQGPLMVALIGASVANPKLGAAMMFAVEGGESYSQMSQYEKRTGQKLDDHEKLLIASGVGAFNAALEKLGIDSILGKIPGIKQKLLKIASAPAMEGTTEAWQEANHMIAQSGYSGDPLFTAENWDRMKHSFYAGAVMGTAAGGSIQGIKAGVDYVSGFGETLETIDDIEEGEKPPRIDAPPEAPPTMPEGEKSQEAGETADSATETEKPPTQRDFSSTHTPLPAKLSREVKKTAESIIDPEDIHPEEGLEQHPHITVKYGLHTGNVDVVERSIPADQGPIEAEISDVEVFRPEGESYEVLVARIKSEQMEGLNKIISQNLPHTDSFPTYNPHLTLGYLKKGTGEKYENVKTGLEGKKVKLDKIEFSSKSGDVQVIDLTKKKRKTPASSAKSVRGWMRQTGNRITTDELKRHGFGEGSKENKSLILQVGSKKGMTVEEVAQQAVDDGIISPPPSNYNLADWFMEKVRANDKTLAAEQATKKREESTKSLEEELTAEEEAQITKVLEDMSDEDFDSYLDGLMEGAALAKAEGKASPQISPDEAQEFIEALRNRDPDAFTGLPRAFIPKAVEIAQNVQKKRAGKPEDLQKVSDDLKKGAAEVRGRGEQKFKEDQAKKGKKVQEGKTKQQKKEELARKVQSGKMNDDMFVQAEQKKQGNLFDSREPAGKKKPGKKRTRKAPPKHSDTGGYDYTNESILDLPEIVEFARTLLRGKNPRIRQRLDRWGNVLGQFKASAVSPEIRLRANLFADPEVAKRTLAHEIGHLIDFLPNLKMTPRS